MDTTPLCFTQLLGQEKAKTLLGRSLARHRIPHGLIFRGPQGVGKSLFGKGLAAAINCKDSNRVGACGICSSCKKFRSMNHPDFMVIQPEKGVMKINQIREMSREISFPPYESATRIIVLEEVHTMRRESANALLKTLEEPPEGNLLILTADSSVEILPTLTSRCQVVPFLPLSFDQTAAILRQRGVNEEDGALLARLSEGSPGKAVALMDSEVVEIWREVIKTISVPSIDPTSDITVLLKLAEKMAATKDDLLAIFELLRLWLRDLLLDENESIVLTVVGQRTNKWSAEQLFKRLEAIDKAEHQLARNCNRSLVCEVLLFTLQ